MQISIRPAVLCASVLLASCASVYGTSPAVTTGDILTGPNGMALYTFDKDGKDSSACKGPCAVNWPPLMAGNADQAHGDYSLVTRDDGSKQWAYKGKPLYYWIKDTKPGDRSGDGVNKVWHLARP